MLNKKVFLITFLSMFIITSLHNLGVRLPQFQNIKIQFKLLSPLPQKTDTLDLLVPKLEQKKMQFELKKDSLLIKNSYASTIFNADNAKAYIVIDIDTGQILLQKNSGQREPIASLTKIMTAVTALDLASPGETFTIENKAAAEIPSIIGVSTGEKLTLTDLLKGVLLMSGNDAAEAIRNGIDDKYKDKLFIRAMNEKAAILGLTNSHFTTPQGFDYGNNYSSASDIAKLAVYAITEYPLINEIVKQDYLTIPANVNHKEFKLTNWNGLLDVYPGTQGVKIGYTEDAGYTTVVFADRNDKKILVVLLGAPGILERDLWTAQLLDFAYQKTLGLQPMNISEDQLQAKYASWYN